MYRPLGIVTVSLTPNAKNVRRRRIPTVQESYNRSNSPIMEITARLRRPHHFYVSCTEVDWPRTKTFCAIKVSDNILVASLI